MGPVAPSGGVVSCPGCSGGVLLGVAQGSVIVSAIRVVDAEVYVTTFIVKH
jgi:hypothetical protein